MTVRNSALDSFSGAGYAVFPGFYDVQSEIEPIREGIREIVALLARKHAIDVPAQTPEQAMMEGYPALIARNRAWGGEVYDAVKQIPDFMRLVSSARNAELFEQLRPGSRAGLAAGGYGIRIDNPNEEKYRALWHQEFPAQLRSLDGIVFWSPLLQLTQEMGPVQIAAGSHAEGLVPVFEYDGGVGRSGAYSLKLEAEEERLKKYDIVAPIIAPGDLLVMDFLTLHQSGVNISTWPRWTMQFRYFNFREQTGIDIAWAGSFAAGLRFEDVLPTLKVRGK